MPKLGMITILCTLSTVNCCVVHLDHSAAQDEPSLSVFQTPLSKQLTGKDTQCYHIFLSSECCNINVIVLD